ncbi:hypothetical protein A7K94_0206225 [Modestobacter sp. VKM Ac-2676]|nr:hypothetical protein A7K94_0206225 [Modestobacter sp. VKM Ac-2676]
MRTAGRSRYSRSEFFATAARRYLDELDAASLTSQIDAALDTATGPDTSSPDAVTAGRRLLDTDDDW